MIPERFPPDPVPAIRPLPEYLAEGRTKARYEDMKQVFQVPWMGVVTMALAHYPTLFDTFWEGLRELSASVPFVEASRGLRSRVEEEVAGLAPPPIAGRLREAGYGPREIDDIRAMVEVFSHGNHAYLPLIALVALLLEGEEPRGGGDAPPFVGRHGPAGDSPFVLMEYHHADAPTRAVYDDIRATLGLPFVNTDYRAFARWPSWFAMAWRDLRPHPGSDPHEAICRAVHDRAFAAALALPNPAGLRAVDLIQAAETDAGIDELRQVARLFYWLIPGLVTNVAFIRHQLLAD